MCPLDTLPQIRLKELNVRDTKKIEALTAQLTKEQGTVADLNKLKNDLESELEEHENMVGELTEQVREYGGRIDRAGKRIWWEN